MPAFFGDGFDLYAATTDLYQGGTYWDSGTIGFTIVAGRFSGSRAIQLVANSTSVAVLLKSSGSNDTVHHLNIGVQQLGAVTGSNVLAWFTFFDGATAQCSVVFRSDGAVLLTTGLSNGTVLATYTGAITAQNTWYGFEIEVVVSNTAGSMTVRKNGNPSNDFASATNLDTSANANNYANRLGIGSNSPGSNNMIDDFLWRSDASSVAWVGDIRCYTRMPASDASVQWTPSAAVVPVANFLGGTNSTSGISTTARYQPFVAPCSGTIGSLSMQCAVAATANFKCSIYAAAAGAPTTVLGSASIVTNPTIGTTTWTFSTPVAVTQGTTYYAAFRADASSGQFAYQTGTPPGGYTPLLNSSTYAAFPETNPISFGAGSNQLVTINITPTAPNASMVADTMQDAAISYVASSTVGQTDLYGIAPITVTPVSVVGVTTRALAQKSDAGTRNIGVQLKSGATTSNGTSTALNTTWGWVYRNDLVDPATGAAWTPTAVNNLQIGELLTA